MPSPAGGGGGQGVTLLVVVVVVCAAFTLLIPQVEPEYVFAGVAGLIVLGAAFLSPQTGLYLLIISMLLSPEFGGGGAEGASQDAVRGFVLRLDDVLLLLIGVGWFTRGAIHKDLGLFRESPLNKPIAAYLAVCIISTLIGTAFGHVRGKIGFFFVVRYFEYFVVLYMVLNYVSTRKQIKRFHTLALIVCIAVALVSMGQIPSGERLSAPFEGEQGEPNTLGGYLVFFLAILLGLGLTARKPKTAVKYFALAGLITIPLLFTLSRASWLAGGPMWITLIALTHKKKSLIAMTVVLAAIGPMIAPTSVQDRAKFIFEQEAQKGQVKVGGLNVDTSTSARLDTWGLAARGWKKKPFFGHGITGFSFLDAQYFRVLVETGLLGFAVFMWLVVALFKVASRAYLACRDDEFLGGLATGYYAGYIALLVHAVGSNTFIILRIMEPFWLYTGLIIVAGEIREAEAAAKAEEAPAEPVLPSGPKGRKQIPARLNPQSAGLRPKKIPQTPSVAGS